MGTNGRVSDGGIIEKTSFYKKLKDNQLDLPKNDENVAELNYVFVADDAFPLQEHIIKPFPQSNLTVEQRICNYRISRARRIVENAFGILTSKFRIFTTEIGIAPEKVDKIVRASCVLHNFLITKSANYLNQNLVDNENMELGSIQAGEWRNEVQSMTSLQSGSSRNCSLEAKENRNNYMKYFNGEGAVPWQQNMI